MQAAARSPLASEIVQASERSAGIPNDAMAITPAMPRRSWLSILDAGNAKRRSSVGRFVGVPSPVSAHHTLLLLRNTTNTHSMGTTTIVLHAGPSRPRAPESTKVKVSVGPQ